MKTLRIAALGAAFIVQTAWGGVIGNLTFLGQFQIPSGQNLPNPADPVFGEISGIDYNPGTGTYTAISDSGADPRFYDLSIDVDGGGINSVTVNSITSILDNGGGAFANAPDPEAIRIGPGGNLFWTSEGNGFIPVDPFVREMTPGGSFVREFSTPGKFSPNGIFTSGVYPNLAFESLTFSPDGTMLFTATENGLAQDGLPATPLNGSSARILAFNVATGLPGAEYIYEVNSVPNQSIPPGQLVTNGLVELLAFSGDTFLAVERDFSTGVGFGLRVYEISIAGATDVSGLDPLAGPYTPVSKQLILDFGTLGIPLDNIEGVTFGPKVGGRRTLVFVSDDNASQVQTTQFLAFQLQAVPEPGTFLLTGFALVGFAALRRRKRPQA